MPFIGLKTHLKVVIDILWHQFFDIWACTFEITLDYNANYKNWLSNHYMYSNTSQMYQWTYFYSQLHRPACPQNSSKNRTNLGKRRTRSRGQSFIPRIIRNDKPNSEHALRPRNTKKRYRRYLYASIAFSSSVNAGLFKNWSDSFRHIRR